MDASDDEGERDPEIDEVLEAALIALESFLASCPQDMRMYTNETITAATRFLKYDPNLAQDDDDEDGMESEEEDALEGDDFEEEAGYDDDEDASWKVRRCAAKVLYTLISTRSNGDLMDDGTLYNKVAPSLVARFKEREDNVRLEVLATLSNLVKRSGDGPSPVKFADEHPQGGTMMPPPSRKRRRGGSDASMLDLHNSTVSMGYASPARTGTPPPDRPSCRPRPAGPPARAPCALRWVTPNRRSLALRTAQDPRRRAGGSARRQPRRQHEPRWRLRPQVRAGGDPRRRPRSRAGPQSWALPSRPRT